MKPRRWNKEHSHQNDWAIPAPGNQIQIQIMKAIKTYTHFLKISFIYLTLETAFGKQNLANKFKHIKLNKHKHNLPMFLWNFLFQMASFHNFWDCLIHKLNICFTTLKLSSHIVYFSLH